MGEIPCNLDIDAVPSATDCISCSLTREGFRDEKSRPSRPHGVGVSTVGSVVGSVVESEHSQFS